MARLAYACVAILIAFCISGFAMSTQPDSQPHGDSAANFGPPDGQPAPAFTARDQFGHEQTLQSLAGKNGTVLLFFRSADW